MSKVFLVAIFLYVLSVAYAEVEVSTKLTVLEQGATVFRLNGQPKTIQKIAKIPDDDGFSNWGDQVYKKRQDDDVLLLRDLVVYPVVSTRDQTLKYTASFKNVRSITSVRFLNVGRERAFGGEIDVYSDGVEVYFTLPAQRDPRALVEVYGYLK